jgi:Tol biopolymer transport system component
MRRSIPRRFDFRPLAAGLVLALAAIVGGCTDGAAPGGIDIPSSGILYVSGGQIHAMRADGSEKTRVTDLPEVRHVQLQVSPDGRQVIVVRTSRSRSDLVGTYVMGTDGSSVRGPLQLGQEYRWSPDGTRIASVRVGEQLDSRIVVTPTDGSAPYDLTPGGFFDDLPSWSPDGERMLFRRRPATTAVAPDLHVVGADGGGLVNLTDDAAVERGSDWSPDGERIAFVSPDRGAGGLFVVEARAGGAVERLSWRSCVGRPRWSPDGERILCASGSSPDGTPEATLDLVVVRADGGEQVVVRDLPRVAGGFAWSFDGGRIVFQSVDEAGRSAVYTIRSDGDDLRLLADGATGSAEPQWYRR